ncbi:MAG: hypothetical protein ACYCZF_17520 [Anaerolineae bacterium]
MSRILLVLLLVVSILMLAGCTAGANPNVIQPVKEVKAAGFWLGLWHGIIAPITFVISLFSKTVNIYEVYNNGGWYNFGFVLGLSISFGGSGAGSRGKRRRKDAECCQTTTQAQDEQ